MDNRFVCKECGLIVENISECDIESLELGGCWDCESWNFEIE